MIIFAAAHFVWAGAQVKPVDGRISKNETTATELAHHMAPGVNLGNTMEACDWNDVYQSGRTGSQKLHGRMIRLLRAISEFETAGIQQSSHPYILGGGTSYG